MRITWGVPHALINCVYGGRRAGPNRGATPSLFHEIERAWLREALALKVLCACARARPARAYFGSVDSTSASMPSMNLDRSS